MPVRDFDSKAQAWHSKWGNIKRADDRFPFALRDWHGYIAHPILRFKLTDTISRDLVSWLPEQIQYRLFRNHPEEVNKPQFRARLAQTVYPQELHPAAKIFTSHLTFLAAIQSSYTYLGTHKSFFGQSFEEYKRIVRSEANKRRRAKRERAKQQQPADICIRGTAQQSDIDSALPTPRPTDSTRPSSSTHLSLEVVPDSPEAQPTTQKLDIEEEFRLYGDIEISPPSP